MTRPKSSRGDAPAAMIPMPARQAVPASDHAPRRMSGGHHGEPHLEPAEVARFAAQMTGELAALARAVRLDLLAYLLEMARHEARNAVGQSQGGG